MSLGSTEKIIRQSGELVGALAECKSWPKFSETLLYHIRRIVDCDLVTLNLTLCNHQGKLSLGGADLYPYSHVPDMSKLPPIDQYLGKMKVLQVQKSRNYPIAKVIDSDDAYGTNWNFRNSLEGREFYAPFEIGTQNTIQLYNSKFDFQSQDAMLVDGAFFFLNLLVNRRRLKFRFEEKERLEYVIERVRGSFLSFIEDNNIPTLGYMEPIQKPSKFYSNVVVSQTGKFLAGTTERARDLLKGFVAGGELGERCPRVVLQWIERTLNLHGKVFSLKYDWREKRIFISPNGGAIAIALRAKFPFQSYHLRVEAVELHIGSTREPRLQDALSPKEQEVALYLAFGMRPIEIAEKLGKTPSTVENQVYAIRRKLSLNTNQELWRYYAPELLLIQAKFGVEF